MLKNNFHLKKCKFFLLGKTKKLLRRGGGLDPTAINLSVYYKRWFEAMLFEAEVNATIATYWYR